MAGKVAESPTPEARIEAEKKRLIKRFAEVGEDKLTTVDKLLDRVAFMTVSLEDLETTVLEKGYTSEYQNGANQWGEKKTPEAEMYLSMMQRYLPAMKQLLDLLPDDDGGRKPGDPVREFIERR